MSKKSQMKNEERKRLEKGRRRAHFAFGLILGAGVGCLLGACLIKYVSKDAKKRLDEKEFYRARLAEIKNALYQIKEHLQFDTSPHEAIDSIENAIDFELNS